MSDDLPVLPEPKPWTRQHRKWVKARIDDAAKRARAVLGAHDVLMVCWFQDIGDPHFLHMQDGGTSPMPSNQVYRYMANTIDEMESGDDEKVQ